MVEVAQANRTVELEGVSVFVVLGRIPHRILVQAFNVALLVISYYPDLDPLLQLALLLLLLDLGQDQGLLLGLVLLNSGVLRYLHAVNVNLAVEQAVALGVAADLFSLLNEVGFHHLPIFLGLVSRTGVPFGIQSGVSNLLGTQVGSLLLAAETGEEAKAVGVALGLLVLGAVAVCSSAHEN